jgi:uncharacterized protein YllA (UPF0747 family)
MDLVKERVEKILQKINIPEKESLLKEIEIESSNPDFWKDPQKATEKMKEMASLQKDIDNQIMNQTNIQPKNKVKLINLFDDDDIKVDESDNDLENIMT